MREPRLVISKNISKCQIRDEMPGESVPPNFCFQHSCFLKRTDTQIHRHADTQPHTRTYTHTHTPLYPVYELWPTAGSKKISVKHELSSLK